jgi:predicted N-acetyltransferase YhbS
MDSAWNDSFAQAERYLSEGVARIFNATEPLCLVIPKGNRMIAASLLDPLPEAPFHLVSGPSVLMEYRNRGIGSRLLYASLEALAQAGVTNPTGITRDKTVASKYVFPKFGGTSERVVLAKSA